MIISTVGKYGLRCLPKIELIAKMAEIHHKANQHMVTLKRGTRLEQINYILCKQLLRLMTSQLLL